MKHAGVVRGHEICHGGALFVPKNMGWLWNVGITGLPTIRRGWRPGAVVKTVAKIMKVYLAEPKVAPPPLKKDDPPTLRVQRKNGEYKIIMNPLRDDTEPVGSPIVFKVTKSEEARRRSKARDIIKEFGYVKKCDCASLKQCNCMNDCDKVHLELKLKEISTRCCLNSELKFSDLKDSSDSEIDMEFTPPSATNWKNPCLKYKPAKTSVAETQYEAQFPVSPKSSKKNLDNDGKSLNIDGKNLDNDGKNSKNTGKNSVSAM